MNRNATQNNPIYSIIHKKIHLSGVFFERKIACKEIAYSGWLLIFDNMEDIELGKDFLPSSRGGALLFTSRRQALGITAQALDLHQMALEEGMRLLLYRARLLESTASLNELPPHEQAAAKELVTLMDSLPLALDQAGAYIEATRCSLTDYLHLFQASSLDLLDEREVHADHPASVALSRGSEASGRAKGALLVLWETPATGALPGHRPSRSKHLSGLPGAVPGDHRQGETTPDIGE
jgi:hypothetical protein